MNINWFNKKNQLPKVKFKNRLKHQSWCFKNDITITLIQKEWNKCFIRINEKGKIIDYCDEKGNIVYYKQNKLKPSDKSWGKKAFELYTEYYNKYNK